MNNSKDISYIIALSIALLTTEIGNIVGDYLTQICGSNWSKVAVILTVIVIVTQTKEGPVAAGGRRG